LSADFLLLGRDCPGPDIDDDGSFNIERDDPEQARAAQPAVPTEPKDHAPLVLLRDPQA
jgi:hypothetical protein